MKSIKRTFSFALCFLFLLSVNVAASFYVIPVPQKGSGSSSNNTIQVCNSGTCEFDTIASALNSIPQTGETGAPSASNPYIIKVGKGSYNLGDEPLIMRPYISIVGNGTKDIIRGKIIVPTKTTLEGFIVAASNSSLENLIVLNRTDEPTLKEKILIQCQETRNFTLRNLIIDSDATTKVYAISAASDINNNNTKSFLILENVTILMGSRTTWGAGLRLTGADAIVSNSAITSTGERVEAIQAFGDICDGDSCFNLPSSVMINNSNLNSISTTLFIENSQGLVSNSTITTTDDLVGAAVRMGTSNLRTSFQANNTDIHSTSSNGIDVVGNNVYINVTGGSIIMNRTSNVLKVIDVQPPQKKPILSNTFIIGSIGKPADAAEGYGVCINVRTDLDLGNGTIIENHDLREDCRTWY